MKGKGITKKVKGTVRYKMKGKGIRDLAKGVVEYRQGL